MARLNRVIVPVNAVNKGILAATAAGLIYTSDRRPGIRRLGHGKRFRYVDARGRILKTDSLNRIRSLAIPPAWRDVWICPDPRGHLQATGRDARGRKQYRYHARWREVRDGAKFGRMVDFARALPVIRRRTESDLRRSGLPREKVLAAVVRLLEKTFIRVGNDEYARDNHSFGLTTMRDGHVKLSGSRVRFIFRGKSGIEHELALEDRRLATIVRQCRDLPGQELFQYRDEDGTVVDIGSGDVNQYLHEIAGREFTSKDFRTWAGTLLAATLLRECAPCESQTRAKKTIVECIDRVAKRLGNTRAVCRKSYVHPAVLDAYLDGTIAKLKTNRVARATHAIGRLTESESAVLGLLQNLGRRSRGAA
jgi:DNA topoisomerase-1